MKIFDVAYYAAIKNFKDIRTVSFVVIASIIMIVILGTALDGEYSKKNLEVEKIAFINEDQGEMAISLEEFLLHDKTKELIEIRFVDSYNEGLALINEGKVEGLIYIPAGFSEDFSRGREVNIEMVASKNYPIVKSLIENYINTVNGRIAIYTIGGNPLSTTSGSYIDNISVTTDGVAPRAIDYYSVQTLLQLLLVGALYGIAIVREDEEKSTLIRIKSAPIRLNQVIIGRTIAGISVLFLQGIIVIAFSKIFYKANWGGSMIINLLVLLIFVIIVIGLGILLGLLIKNPTAAMGTLYGLAMTFSITSGAISKFATGGKIGSFIAKLSPNYYATRAIFSNIYSGDISLISSYTGVLVVMAAGIYLTSLLLGRRRFN